MDNTPDQSVSSSPKLLEQVVAKMWVKHYSIRSETQYLDGRRGILMHAYIS